MPLTTVIADDEQLARDELQYLLQSSPDVTVVAQAANGLEAVTLVKQHHPDLLILDVQMPGLDGFGVIKKLIASKTPLPLVVFATAFDQYAVKAFEINALDYILKPYDKKRIHQAVEKAKRQAQESRANDSPAAPYLTADKIEALLKLAETPPQFAPRPAAPPTKILLRAAGRMFLVDQKDICYATINDGVITVVTGVMGGEANVRTLEELLEMLNPHVFWRAHGGFLVNINRIREGVPSATSSYLLKMDDGNNPEVPVARAQTKRLRELFKL